MWNSFDDNLKNSSSLNSFKYNLKKDNFASVKVPIYYTYGDRYISVMHAGIRINFSYLSHDLLINHLAQNPLYSCNLEIENAEHFFFRCPKYVNKRTLLFRETHVFHPLNLMNYLLAS